MPRTELFKLDAVDQAKLCNVDLAATHLVLATSSTYANGEGFGGTYKLLVGIVIHLHAYGCTTARLDAVAINEVLVIEARVLGAKFALAVAAQRAVGPPAPKRPVGKYEASVLACACQRTGIRGGTRGCTG